MTDQPTAHRSVGTKPTASTVLADGDGQDLSIRFIQLAWSQSVSHLVITVPSYHSPHWGVCAWCAGSCTFCWTRALHTAATGVLSLLSAMIARLIAMAIQCPIDQPALIKFGAPFWLVSPTSATPNTSPSSISSGAVGDGALDSDCWLLHQCF